MNIKMEYKKGILFIRIIGKFNRITYKYFNEEVFPVLLKNELKYIVINLDKLINIDKYGIKSLIDLININKSYKGRIIFCNLKSSVKSLLEESIIKNDYFISENELESVRMFEL